MDEESKLERRVSQQDLLNEVRAHQSSIEDLQAKVDNLEEILKPVAEFYTLMRSDVDTLGRLGRWLRGFLAWGAAIIISAGVLVAWAKNGFKFPGG